MKLHLRKNILTAIVFGSIFSVSAQIDTTIWNSTKKIEDNRFVAEIPQDWKVVTIANASEYSHKYEFTGIGIKPMVLQSPVTAFLTIKKATQTDVKAILEEELKDFNTFYDKVQEANYSVDSSTVKLKTGEDGFYLHTRFYRRSKASNYSRFYLVAQNKKTNDYYVFAYWFQYKDPTYDIERNNRLKEYVLKAMSNISFR